MSVTAATRPPVGALAAIGIVAAGALPDWRVTERAARRICRRSPREAFR